MGAANTPLARDSWALAVPVADFALGLFGFRSVFCIGCVACTVPQPFIIKITLVKHF